MMLQEPLKLPFTDPKVRRLVTLAYPSAKTRRPVRVRVATTYRVSDYWDGGSRDYAVFVNLRTGEALTSAHIPAHMRQAQSNPFNLPIADVTLSPDIVVVEHTIFRGKDLGYYLHVHPGALPEGLPEAIIPRLNP